MILARELVAESGYRGGPGLPELFVGDHDSGIVGDEFLVVGDTFTQEVDGSGGSPEHVGERAKVGGFSFLPGEGGGFAVEAGGEDLIALRVEDEDEVLRFRRGVLREDQDGGDGNKLYAGREGQGFRQRDTGPQAGKGAGAGGDIEFFEVGGF